MFDIAIHSHSPALPTIHRSRVTGRGLYKSLIDHNASQASPARRVLMMFSFYSAVKSKFLESLNYYSYNLLLLKPLLVRFD